MKKNNLLKWAPIVLTPLLLFSPLLITGKALFWGTPSTQFIPWWNFAWQSILHGQLPLWNPLLGMGAPLAANYQSGLFYPPYWILFLVYTAAGLQWMAWSVTLIVCAHLIISGIGTSLLLKNLKVSDLGQIIGGLAFSLSGYLIARAGFLSINAAVSWFPWILLLSKALVDRKRQSLVRLSVVLALQFLAGHAQTAWYGLLFTAVWVLFWSWSTPAAYSKSAEILKAVSKFIAAGLIAAGLSAIQLLPTLEYLLLSHRSTDYGYAEAVTYSFWPWRFLTFIAPDLFGNPAKGNYWGYGNYWEDAVYIGLLPLLLAVGISLWAFWKAIKDRPLHEKGNNRNLIYLLDGMLIISMLLALGDHTALFPFLYRHIPSFNLFQAPTRWSIWAMMSLAILAGLAVDHIKKPEGRLRYFLRLTAAGFAAITGSTLAAEYFMKGIKATFFPALIRMGLIGLAGIILLLAYPEEKDRHHQMIWGSAFLALIIIDLIGAGWGLNPGIDKDFYQSAPISRSESTGRIWMPEDVEYTLKFDKYFQFNNFTGVKDWTEMITDHLPNTGMMEGIEMVNNFDPIVPRTYQTWMERLNDGSRSSRLLEMMDVKAVINLKDGKAYTEVLTRTDTVPSVRVVGCAGISGDQNAILDQIMTDSTSYLDNVILTSSHPLNCSKDATGYIRVVEHKNGKLKLEVNLAQDGWIFWSQTWYPGWKAILDNKTSLEVTPANYLFQAVPVEAGQHQVEFVYWPKSFLVGSILSTLSLIILVCLYVTERKQAKEPN